MPLFRQRIWRPGGGHRAHDRSWLEGNLSIYFGSVGDATDISVQFAAGDQHGVTKLLG